MPTVIQNVLVGSKAESQMLRGIASEKSSPNVLHVWLAGGVTPWTNAESARLYYTRIRALWPDALLRYQDVKNEAEEKYIHVYD